MGFSAICGNSKLPFGMQLTAPGHAGRESLILKASPLFSMLWFSQGYVNFIEKSFAAVTVAACSRR